MLEAAGAQPDGICRWRFESLRPAPAQDLQADTAARRANRPHRLVLPEPESVGGPRLTDLTFGAAVQRRWAASPPGHDGAAQSSQAGDAAPGAFRICAPHGARRRRPRSLAGAGRTASLPTRAAVRGFENRAPRASASGGGEFWDRSWIFVTGDDDARRVTEGYALQRFVSACAGRGAYPIKFNGSIFTMDIGSSARTSRACREETLLSADERDWGGQYWFQNTRPMYWPMLQSGDFDMMRPLFRMYQDQLPGNAKAVHAFYGHDGAYFAETNPFWGSLPNIKPGEAGNYTKHYFTPILELRPR